MNGLFPARPVPVAPPPGETVRAFVGNGDVELPVPGCKRATSVRVGMADIPQYVTNKFPVGQGDPQEMISQDWPLWMLATADDGTPVLRRSMQSNDGIWQEGVQILVAGEFEPEKPVKTKSAEKAGE